MLVLVAACSDGGRSTSVDASLGIDSSSQSCKPAGTGTVTGTSRGVTLGPIRSAYLLTLNGMTGLILDDTAGTTCSVPTMTGYTINFVFCTEPQANHYTTDTDGGWTCPNPMPIATIRNNVTNSDHADGLPGGSIDVTGKTPECISGTYSLMFDNGGGSASGDPVSGTFDAVICRP